MPSRSIPRQRGAASSRRGRTSAIICGSRRSWTRTAIDSISRARLTCPKTPSTQIPPEERRMKSPMALVLTGGLLAAGAATLAFHARGSSPPVQSSRSATPLSLDDGWPTGSLEQAGINRERIEAMTGSIRAHPEYNVHALLIERDGRLVYEEYFSGKDERWGAPLGEVTFTRETKHDLRSVTKSVVSALV